MDSKRKKLLFSKIFRKIKDSTRTLGPSDFDQWAIDFNVSKGVILQAVSIYKANHKNKETQYDRSSRPFGALPDGTVTWASMVEAADKILAKFEKKSGADAPKD